LKNALKKICQCLSAPVYIWNFEELIEIFLSGKSLTNSAECGGCSVVEVVATDLNP
jgi:hypothetical protein